MAIAMALAKAMARAMARAMAGAMARAMARAGCRSAGGRAVEFYMELKWSVDFNGPPPFGYVLAASAAAVAKCFHGG